MIDINIISQISHINLIVIPAKVTPKVSSPTACGPLSGGPTYRDLIAYRAFAIPKRPQPNHTYNSRPARHSLNRITLRAPSVMNGSGNKRLGKGCGS
jgi:hypothetical protein